MYCLNPSLWHDRRRRIGFGSADCRIDRAFLGDQVPIATACLHPGWSQAKFDTARWATRPPNIPVLRLRHMRLDTVIGSQAPNRPENDHSWDSFAGEQRDIRRARESLSAFRYARDDRVAYEC